MRTEEEGTKRWVGGRNHGLEVVQVGYTHSGAAKGDIPPPGYSHPFLTMCDYFKIQFMQHFTQKFLPVALNYMWVTNAVCRQDQAQITLRNDDLLFIPLAGLSSTSKHPQIVFPKLWSEFPDEGIKFMRSKLEFNSKLKNYFVLKLKSTISCGRLLCPDSYLQVQI